MSEKQNKVKAADLANRQDAELHTLIADKAEQLRKARFKHALGQLRETHTLRVLRREIATLNTVLSSRAAQG